MACWRLVIASRTLRGGRVFPELAPRGPGIRFTMDAPARQARLREGDDELDLDRGVERQHRDTDG